VKDTDISAGCAIAYGAWVASLIIWGVGWGTGSGGLRTLSIIVCGIAATATVRTYFVEFSAMVRRAFDQDVTTLRR
jgi:hypothetical protein